ncbi:MAG: DUF1015 domain-containing protein [Reichenbachiella sp.]
MALIQPFRGFRYNETLGKRIDKLTSPLFDVVSEQHRQKLYKNSKNSIHLSVPTEGYESTAYADRIIQWKKEGVIVREDKPSIYVYYQYFHLPNDSKSYCRKGFIANVQLYEWEDQVILRHENTIPQSVDGRKAVLKETGLNVSPTHGLYTDSTYVVEPLMNEAIENPIYDSVDYQGVRDVLGIIDDPNKCAVFVDLLSEKQIILADGHHRYQGALNLRNEQKDASINFSDNDSLNHIMMYLTNTESDDLKIFPTHRLIKGIPDFNQEWFLEKLENYFHIQELEDDEDVFNLIAGKRWAFGLFIGEKLFNIRLRQQKHFEMEWELPDLVKDLDVTVLHYYIFEKVLKIRRDEQPKSEYLSFERNLSVCYRKSIKGEINAALITQSIPMETVKSVCYSGTIMPQKSTYFYPKVICGYLFSSIKPEDHE